MTALADLRQLGRELYDDLLWRYEVMSVPGLPLGLGQLRQRMHRITCRTEHWWRFADDVVWLHVAPADLGPLALCKSAEDIRALIAAPPTCRVERAAGRPGGGAAAGPAPTGLARSVVLPRGGAGQALDRPSGGVLRGAPARRIGAVVRGRPFSRGTERAGRSLPGSGSGRAWPSGDAR